MTTSETAYPLQWPVGRKRTGFHSRENARFDVSFARARDNITAEILLLCGRYGPSPLTVISTNIPLRRDGLPLAGQKTPEDSGVAVYFTYKGRQMSFCCDRWKKIEHNMQAIAKTIEALRGIARWGTGDMLEAAFTGFTALPPPTAKDWQSVLDLRGFLLPKVDDVELAYRRLASQFHPDKPGGSAEKMVALNLARAQAIKELTA